MSLHNEHILSENFKIYTVFDANQNVETQKLPETKASRDINWCNR